MLKHAFNIIVPVDFSASSVWAVRKAISLAKNLHGNIHLVQVLPQSKFSILPMDGFGLFSIDLDSAAEETIDNLEMFKSVCIDLTEKTIGIHTKMLQGEKTTVISDYINENSIDLIVMGVPENNFFKMIYARRILRTLSNRNMIPVLGVGREEALPFIKKIVLPLSDALSVKSLKLAAMFARSFRSTLYIVGLKPIEGIISVPMEKAKEIVKSMSAVPVQCYLLEGSNLAESSVQFAKRIHADLLMVNPLKEFNLPGFWNRATNKIISCAQYPVIMVK